MKTLYNSRISMEDLKESKIKTKIQTKENLQDLKLSKVNPREEEDPPAKVTSTTTSRSQSNFPSPIMEVDSSEDSGDSEDSLSKYISSSDSLPSATELNKSEVTLRRSRKLEIGIKNSQRKSYKPATSLKIYDAIDLTCEHCQSNYHTSDEFSKLFLSF
ncbi:hypothetical protein O181_031963 [Austropuccinia psidii MF-1]|uniref:Uncharacterized protein n=1 Tax=Austropuccinia psidii MF-1 TaxID=1389203 RepID=A0A9Q3H538_9BASI|nr:hypothetical protein [Austropuccinia psidii MF-1]